LAEQTKEVAETKTDYFSGGGGGDGGGETPEKKKQPPFWEREIKASACF